MKTNYQKKLRPVIRYLEKHFDQPMNLEKVAALAHLSPYHFHRVFKAVTGETLNEFTRRLRLEKIAGDLFHLKPTISEIALDHGFSSSQSLAKAFKQHFGLTPGQVRDCSDLDTFMSLLHSSKIGHALSKAGHADTGDASYNEAVSIKRRAKMETKHFESGHLAYIRVTGPYGENYELAVNKLYAWAGTKGLADKPCIFVYHDNPEITPAEKCRTDIGLLLDNPVETQNEIECEPFEGGSYAFIRKTITDKSQYPKAWEELMSGVVENGLETDDRPCFELYHSYDTDTGVADISCCAAVKRG